jgi:3D-(3,5/4)-trihydroxycyclohexane-1,2-dione acylhydrolase (decyclizing)
MDFLDLVDGVAVTTPIASGAVPASNMRCMFVGGSKGSVCGNYAMENADLLVSIGTRFVCQSDCSRTGYPQVQRVINFNNDPELAMHYNKTIAFVGDAALSLEHMNEILRKMPPKNGGKSSAWLQDCQKMRGEWMDLIEERTAVPMIFDPVWGKPVFTQPAVIRAALEWAQKNKAKTIFDAGDVQANGFQLSQDDSVDQTFNETGASYMGFAVSALLATGIADEPFYGLAVTGDGSFTMTPQILIDGVEHKARGCILLLDNRRMGAITGLQLDQYGQAFATHDSVEVDYLAWAKAIKGINALPAGNSLEELLSALDQALAYPGLSLIYVPVYFGSDQHGGLGVYGRWNVGNWSKKVQTMRHEIGL